MKRMQYLLFDINRNRFLNFKTELQMPTNLEYQAAQYPQYAKRWLSPDDLEQEYGFSKSTQSKMRMSSNPSTIPFSKIGGKYIRYDRTMIDQWLEDHQVQGGVK